MEEKHEVFISVFSCVHELKRKAGSSNDETVKTNHIWIVLTTVVRDGMFGSTESTATQLLGDRFFSRQDDLVEMELR